jgi:hypothetical protein
MIEIIVQSLAYEETGAKWRVCISSPEDTERVYDFRILESMILFVEGMRASLDFARIPYVSRQDQPA